MAPTEDSETSEAGLFYVEKSVPPRALTRQDGSKRASGRALSTASFHLTEWQVSSPTSASSTFSTQSSTQKYQVLRGQMSFMPCHQAQG